MLHLVDLKGATRETALALDSEVRVGSFRVQAEYIRKQVAPVEGRDERVIRWGWYATMAYDAGTPAGVPTKLHARYDAVTQDRGAGTASLPGSAGPALGTAGGRTGRLTAGVNAWLFELVALKLEYQRYLAAPAGVRSPDGFEKDASFARVVVVF